MVALALICCPGNAVQRAESLNSLHGGVRCAGATPLFALTTPCSSCKWTWIAADSRSELCRASTLSFGYSTSLHVPYPPIIPPSYHAALLTFLYWPFLLLVILFLSRFDSFWAYPHATSRPLLEDGAVSEGLETGCPQQGAVRVGHLYRRQASCFDSCVVPLIFAKVHILIRAITGYR